MRATTLLISLSVVGGWAGNTAAQSPGAIVIHSAPAGQAPRFELPSGVDGTVKARFLVEKPDGTRVELPSQAVSTPPPPASRIIEGPVLPPDCGGGSLKIEIYDTETSERLKTSIAPIGF